MLSISSGLRSAFRDMVHAVANVAPHIIPDSIHRVGPTEGNVLPLYLNSVCSFMKTVGLKSDCIRVARKAVNVNVMLEAASACGDFQAAMLMHVAQKMKGMTWTTRGPVLGSSLASIKSIMEKMAKTLRAAVIGARSD